MCMCAFIHMYFGICVCVYYITWYTCLFQQDIRNRMRRILRKCRKQNDFNFNSESTGVSDTHATVNSHRISIKQNTTCTVGETFYLTYVCPASVLSERASFVLRPGSRWHEAVLMRLKGSSPLFPSSSLKYVSSNCVPGFAVQGGWRQN